jgi:tRNA-Thr(GGU) m(6)t(6)A37 methyltransferase TsaA
VITLEPIAYFHSIHRQKADLPRQPALAPDHLGEIRFLPGKNFEQALEDLKGTDRIWVLFWMDQVKSWKPKVQPPRNVSKKSVFATRSPHRPNPIGLSCVKLVAVEGLTLFIQEHDLVDGSPILDIKPYLAYADSFPEARLGWTEELEKIPSYEIDWEDLSRRQLAFLEEQGIRNLRQKIEERLRHFEGASTSNRIEKVVDDMYKLSYRTWRIFFQLSFEEKKMVICLLDSGYDEETLQGSKPSRWEDVPLHRSFLLAFDKDLRYVKKAHLN